MSKHSSLSWIKAEAKREWTAEANFRCGSFSSAQICAKGRKDPVCIVVQADPRGYRSGDAELDANVDFIIRAVNAHDDLVAALLPLARAASDWDPEQNAGDVFSDSENVAHGETSVTVGDLRRARAALLKLGVK